MRGSNKALMWAAACWLVSAAALWRVEANAPALATAPLSVSSGPVRSATLVPRSASTLPMPPGVPAAHASALAALPHGDVLAVWWAGQRESAPDVQVYASRWHAGQWSAARPVVNREALGRALHMGVRRIGNPVLWVAPDGRVHLYVVSTGLGGWAAGRVAQLVSSDGGESFTPQRILPLTPFANTSVLVRTHPVALADGGWLLPAYFELRHKYPLLVAFGADGEPRWVQRIASDMAALQPALLPVSGTELRALMRDHGPQHRMQQALSLDAGRSWQALPAAALSNHDSSLAALRLSGGGYVLVHNERLPEGGSPRQWLRLSTSTDAAQWASALDVSRGVPGDEFSYPSLLQVGQQLHVTYTHQRAAIAHKVYDIEYPEVVR